MLRVSKPPLHGGWDRFDTDILHLMKTCISCTNSHRCLYTDACYKCFSECLLYLWLIGEWGGGTGDELSNLVRHYIFNTRGKQCEQCGWAEINPITKNVPVNIDHINGNPTDHTYDNLRVLCPNCHSLTENFGFLNKGNGRARRRKPAFI